MMDKLHQLINNSRLLAFALIVLSLAVSVGCGPSKEPTGSISGSVMFDGEAVENCQVEIFDSVARRSIGALADEQGKFEMKEVPLAEYQVAVHQVLDPHAAGNIPLDPRIPETYRAPDTSGITVSVGGEPVVLDIDMK